MSVSKLLEEIVLQVNSMKQQLADLKNTLYLLQQEIPQLQLDLLGDAVEEVMDTHEVLSLLKVSNTTLGRYKVGKVPKGKPPFPKPIGRGAYGKRYRRQDIERWANSEMN